jgi:hypothetical protein
MQTFNATLSMWNKTWLPKESMLCCYPGDRLKKGFWAE